MNKRFALFLFFFCFFIVSGCTGLKLISSWAEKTITIDGNDEEWHDIMYRVKSFYVGVCNDSEYLYLCLSTTDKKVKPQLMGLYEQDFMVWFDPEGKKSKAFGLKFSNDSSKMNASYITKRKSIKIQDFNEIAKEMMDNLQVEIMNNDYPVALITDTEGIDVSIGISMQGRKLVYELKVPIKKTDEFAYAIQTLPGEEIGIGLETSGLDLTSMRDEMMNNAGGGQSGMKSPMGKTRGGGMGGKGGKGGGMYSGSLPSYPRMMELVNIWAKINLASNHEKKQKTATE